MPALSPDIIEPIWEQFLALLPEREVEHPLGCHNPRIPEKVVFDKLLVQVLIFGCAYDERIADQRRARPPPSGADATSGSSPECLTPTRDSA